MALEDLPSFDLNRIFNDLDMISLLGIYAHSFNKRLIEFAVNGLKKYNVQDELSRRIAIVSAIDTDDDDYIVIINHNKSLSSNVNIIMDETIDGHILQISPLGSGINIIGDNNLIGTFYPESGHWYPSRNAATVIKIVRDYKLTNMNTVYCPPLHRPYAPGFIINDIAVGQEYSQNLRDSPSLYLLTDKGTVNKQTFDMDTLDRLYQNLFPGKYIISIAGGFFVCYGLTIDGEVYYSYNKLYSNPENPAIGLSSMGNNLLILLNDRTIVGFNDNRPMPIPEDIQGKVLCVKAGKKKCAAVLASGQVISWNVNDGIGTLTNLQMF